MSVRVSLRLLFAILVVVVLVAARTVVCRYWPGPASSETQPIAAKAPARSWSPAIDPPLSSRTRAGWPNLFGPYHDNVSAETHLAFDWPPAGPPVLWTREIHAGYSAPVVGAGRLIVFQREGDREIVECLDALTGNSLWALQYPCTWVNEQNHYGAVPIATPIISGGRVYTLGVEGTAHCLELESGAVLWKRSLHDDHQAGLGLFGVGASPLLEGALLIVNVGGTTRGAGIVGLDKETGETVWTATDHPASYATPRAATIHGTRYVFVFTDRGLVCLDPSSGRVYWQVPFRSKMPDSPNAASPLVYGDRVLVTGYALGSLCVRVLPEGGYEQVWRDRRVLDSQYNNLACLDGYVYGFSALDTANSFRCLELATGKLRWSLSSPLGCGASLAADGHFIILGEYGHLASVSIDPAEPRLQAITKEPLLPDRCYIAPALADGLLYLRGEDRLVCLDLRTPQEHRLAAVPARP
jgi:outer membrane protein assembly factor BamB